MDENELGRPAASIWPYCERFPLVRGLPLVTEMSMDISPESAVGLLTSMVPTSAVEPHRHQTVMNRRLRKILVANWVFHLLVVVSTDEWICGCWTVWFVRPCPLLNS
uniref:Uncharacterized protein n=1 Tax=Spongospora subterranea TaxID=70186 RepID=A0A0H5QZ71_9EUKA|eukprot:CRZ00844.1 hypothetical protein [Spongospora subterranea]